jgi:hypothetical protein
LTADLRARLVAGDRFIGTVGDLDTATSRKWALTGTAQFVAQPVSIPRERTFDESGWR